MGQTFISIIVAFGCGVFALTIICCLFTNPDIAPEQGDEDDDWYDSFPSC